MKLSTDETYYLIDTLLMAMTACTALAQLRGDQRLGLVMIGNPIAVSKLLNDIVPCSMAVFLSEIIERAEGIALSRRHREIFTEWLALAEAIQAEVENNE